VSWFRGESLARHLLQRAWDSSVVALDKTYLIEPVTDMRPLWDQRDKSYHNRDLNSKLWEDIGEKLNDAVSTEIITLMEWVTAYLYT
jgi:hypothetical protein